MGYTYDDAPGGDTYRYDENGNRVLRSFLSYTYDAADQMLSAGGISYGYDANGNQTSMGANTFTYDHENRLTQSVIGGAASSSVYNGDGLRMSHTAGGQTTSYTWDVAAGLPVVLKDNAYTYVYGLDLISVTDSGGNQNYYLHNGLGSVTNIVDYNGNEKALYFYGAFGNPRYAVELTSNLWRYTGEQRDADSGLYYLRARYYDPATGRFLSRDAVPGFAEKPSTQNPYAYALNNPCNLIDPSGNLAQEGGLVKLGCHAELDLEGIGRFPGRVCLPFVGCTEIELFPADTLVQLDVDVNFTISADGSTTASVTKADVDTPWLGGVIGNGWKTDSFAYTKSNNQRNVSVFGFAHRDFPADISASVGLHFAVDRSGNWAINASKELTGSFSKAALAITWKGSCNRLP